MATKVKVTRKSTAAKSASKGKAAAKAQTNGGTRAPKRVEKPTQDQLATAKRLAGEGKSLAQIAKALKVKENRAMFIVRFSQVKPSELIKGDLTGAKVVALRAEGLAWHTIATRAQLGSPTPVKKLFEAETGQKATGRAGLPEGAQRNSKSTTKRSSGKTTKKGGSRPSKKA